MPTRTAAIRALVMRTIVAQVAYDALGIGRRQLKIIATHVKRLIVEVDHDFQFAIIMTARGTSFKPTLVIIINTSRASHFIQLSFLSTQTKIQVAILEFLCRVFE